jgi:methyl-accepting chemotaxis protein
VRQRAADVIAAADAFRATMTGPVESASSAMLNATTKLVAAFQQRAAAVRTDASAGVSRAETVVIGTVAAAILIGLSLSFVIARGIVRPLQSMTRAMNRLAAGNADIEVAGRDRADEIGDMARALDVFRQNADKIVAMMKAEQVTREIGEIIAGAAKGDLTRRVDLGDKSGFLRDIGAQVNTLLESSNDAMRDFGVKATQTAGSVNEASVAVGQVSDGARAQMASLTQVAAALNDSAAAIRMVSEGTQTASEKAAASSAIVRQALAAVEKLVAVVDAIGQNSRKINQITQVIAQIANRTHILSLNAAIEAARAGEHGKGFVVVAQEVGKLAESAAQNARQITEIVEQANQDAQDGRAATGDVRSAIQSVAAGTSETTDIIRSVSVAMEQQRAGIAQIDQRVSDLRAIASSNAAASEEIAATMLQLAELATDTRERIARFRTT